MCIPREAEGGVPGVVAEVSSEAVVEGVGVVGEGVGGDVGGVGSGVIHGSVWVGISVEDFYSGEL